MARTRDDARPKDYGKRSDCNGRSQHVRHPNRRGSRLHGERASVVDSALAETRVSGSGRRAGQKRGGDGDPGGHNLPVAERPTGGRSVNRRTFSVRSASGRATRRRSVAGTPGPGVRTTIVRNRHARCDGGATQPEGPCMRQNRKRTGLDIRLRESWNLIVRLCAWPHLCDSRAKPAVHP